MQIEIYNSPDNKIELKVKLDKEPVWLSQNEISELFERERSVITKHIRIFSRKVSWMKKIADLLFLKYDSIADAKRGLGDIATIRNTFIRFQSYLYDHKEAV